MKKLKEIFKKKVKGDAGYLAALFSIFAIVVCVVGCIYVYGGAIKQNDAWRVHRKYLLAMEIEGYLSDANRISMVNELTAMGCNNISVNGSLSPVGYGNRVVLRIECDMQVRGLVIDASGKRADWRLVHLVMEKEGIALY